uniref:Uncharacterized protein n=1 Tax=Siphoviridae sp. ctsxw88 TaxID=2825701 RepID=A0A8S5PIR6_9CAUD|nr:MAG TPA: hypothetical protein [Siphoviridae sp. ctsxw88]
MLKQNIETIDKEIIKLANMPINDNTAKALSIYGTARAELKRLYKTENAETEQNKTDIAEKEYKDIQPRYAEYCNVKKQYQLNTVPQELLKQSTKYLCKEIEEFIQILYTNSDTDFEKTEFKNSLEKMLDFISKL